MFRMIVVIMVVSGLALLACGENATAQREAEAISRAKGDASDTYLSILETTAGILKAFNDRNRDPRTGLSKRNTYDHPSSREEFLKRRADPRYQKMYEGCENFDPWCR